MTRHHSHTGKAELVKFIKPTILLKKKKNPHKHKVQIEKKRNGAAFTGELPQQSKASPVNKGQPPFASYFSITGR